MRRLSSRVESGEIRPEDITEEMIGRELDTADLPDPDLLIRTCNEQRVSNFLLWQLAYTELYFTPVAWPDFDRQELEKAVAAYATRTRKFGGLKETEPAVESEAQS